MLNTEKRNPKTMHIDTMSIAEMLRVIQEENENSVRAVEAALDRIGEAVEVITVAFEQGGRLIYVGAGTSGRLGVLDASECPPTFGVNPEQVIGVMAGGKEAMFRASENLEDSAEAGVRDMMNIALTSKDVVVGISASGGAVYVNEALAYARSLGCTTVGVTSNTGTGLETVSDICIITETGAEVITGSTRMKAGTAQKIVLNMLSTCAMVRSGHVYENLMINLRPSNDKLRKRMVRIVATILNVSEEEAMQRLEENEWNIRRAVKA